MKSSSTNPRIIKPNEFLEWSKLDLEKDDNHAIGNAIGNMKRAIHCRIDEIINNTHIKFCSDWNKKAFIDKKIKVLKALDIPYSAIIRLLTDIRNSYEHKYLITEYDKAEAYQEIAELWIKNSYDNYSFNRIAITKLETKNFGVHSGASGIRLNGCELEERFDFDYLWDNKKEIHEVKNGVLKIIPMNTIPWEKMILYEKKHIQFTSLTNSAEFCVPARIITRVYKKALKNMGI